VAAATSYQRAVGLAWGRGGGGAAPRATKYREIYTDAAPPQKCSSGMCVLGLLLTVVTWRKSGCVSFADCQYNGVCTSNICQCHAGWRGADCGSLNLAPASPANGFRQDGSPHRQFTSTWGGSIHRADPTGSHFLVAAEITNGCGVKNYKTNSRAALAMSTTNSAEGPYIRIRTAIPVEAHNIQTTILPDSTVVAFILGDGHQHPDTPQVNCTSPSLEPNPPPSLLTRDPPKCGDKTWTGGACIANITVFHAQNISAEFKPVVVQIHLLDGVGIENFNPSPHVFSDGRVALLFNAKLGGCCLCEDRWEPCLAFATAPSWRGPYTMTKPRLWPGTIDEFAFACFNWLFTMV
jgi:hypothetical protein